MPELSVRRSTWLASFLHAVADYYRLGILHDYLSSFISTTLPAAKPGKKSKFVLGVSDHKIGNSIQETLGVSCVCDELTNELLRGIRLHFTHFIDVSHLRHLNSMRLFHPVSSYTSQYRGGHPYYFLI